MENNQIEANIRAHDKIFKIYNLKHTEIYNPVEQNRIKKVISNIVKKNKNLRILDIGAGTGNLALKFLDLNCKVTAADVSFKSLKLLKQLSYNNANLKLVIIKDQNLPFPDNKFDVVCTYSVLHHIPDYLFTIKEMIRVCKSGGLIYIDHEVSEKRWNPNKHLLDYYKKTKETKTEYLIRLIKTKELFTFDFIKIFFIKIFINKKYEVEGDIHVFKNDHIEWNKIKDLIKKKNCKIVKEIDYLMYAPKGGKKLYEKYKNKYNDTKYIIIRK